MSDATHTRSQIDIGIGILVDRCGYSPEAARAELTAFSQRHKAGLMPIGTALTLLTQWSPASTPIDDATSAARAQWNSILRNRAPHLSEQAA